MKKYKLEIGRLIGWPLDTTVGLITDNNETAYREDIKEQSPINIDWTRSATAPTFKFLGHQDSREEGTTAPSAPQETEKRQV